VNDLTRRAIHVVHVAADHDADHASVGPDLVEETRHRGFGVTRHHHRVAVAPVHGGPGDERRADDDEVAGIGVVVVGLPRRLNGQDREMFKTSPDNERGMAAAEELRWTT